MGEIAETRARAAAIAAATFVAGAMIAQQVAGKAARDALFLTHFPATRLPSVMLLSAAMSFGVVLVISRAMTRRSPARVVPVVFATSGALYVIEWALFARAPHVIAFAVYVHTAALGAAVVSSFWSVINERFDPHTAKRVITSIAAGATAGGLVGGVAAWQGAHAVSLPQMLLGLGALNVACAVGVVRIGAAPRRAAAPEPTTSALRVIREVPYLRQLAIVVLVGTMGEACIDYVFKAQAAGSFSTGERLITFFAIYHMGVGVLTFGVQTTLARRALQQLGLAGTVATLPITLLSGGALALIVPRLWSVVVLRGGHQIVQNSLFRSGYELLYTPLTPARKRPSKTFIDVGADRVGAALGSGAAALAVALVPAVASSLLLGVAIATALVSLALANYLHRGYVAALADSLRSGAVALDDLTVIDATTRRTLSDTTVALDRDKLLREIELLRRREGQVDAPAAAPAPAPSAAVTAVPADRITRAVDHLRSGDAARIREVLAHEPLAPELVAHALPLLARDDLQRDVVRTLRTVAPRCAGQLIDALLDPATEFAVRRRLPRVLAVVPSQRVVDGLLEGLADKRFEVRYRCGVALVRLCAQRGELTVPRASVLAAARREAALGDEVWNSQGLVDGLDDESPFSDVNARRISRSLEHVFTILSLVLEREPLRLAYRALAAEDEALRGTGLEYLENVLPAEIREALWPFLGDRKVARRVARPQRQVLDELLTSMDSAGIDVEALRKALGEPES